MILSDKIYSSLKYKEAEWLVGKKVLFCNMPNYYSKGDIWMLGVLFKINMKSYPFVDAHTKSQWNFIKTCSETFEKKDNKENLIDALKLSILQWEMMVLTGKSKSECYIALGGEYGITTSCFLCDYTYRNTKHSMLCKHNCITWRQDCDTYIACLDTNSTYQKWYKTPSKENALAVINHMKLKLSELEKERN